jgi:Tfp pilus assembly protein PilN
MRPINLIPSEERHGQQAPLRSGPLVYIVVGALVAALVAVTVLVLTNNQISDRKDEVAQLKKEDTEASAEAQRLAAYTQFQTLHEQRLATITSLADSRFDWERVMRELSLVLPADVWLVNLTASASGSGGEGAGSTSSGKLSGSIAGPTLEITGCAKGQEGVAGFVTALKDIDGVTRVGVESSELSEQMEGAGSSSGGGSTDDCRTRDYVALFSLTVAFDAAPVPVSSGSEETAPITPTEKSEASASELSGEKSEEESEG